MNTPQDKPTRAPNPQAIAAQLPEDNQTLDAMFAEAALDPQPSTQQTQQDPVPEKEDVAVGQLRAEVAKNPTYLATTSAIDDGLEVLSVTEQNRQATSEGPAENPRVIYERDFDLEKPKPFHIDDAIELPITTHMFLLSEQGEEVDRRIRALVTPTALNSVQGKAWNTATMVAASLSAQQEMMQHPAQMRDGSQWKQYMEHEGARHSFFTPKIETDKMPINDPINARIRVRTLMGVGGVISIPLFHSGFWIMLSAPSDGALYELNRRFNEEKVSLGRQTQGLIFSNEQVYMNSWLLEFCLDHCYDATVKYADREELRKLIKVTDLPVLFTGLARLIWPNGYRYVRSVSTAKGIAGSSMVEGKLDLAKLLYVDNPFFNTWQHNSMANRNRATVKQEDLARYQSEFPFAAGRVVEFNENIKVRLHVPNAEDSVNDGDRWVSGLVQMVDETFTTTRPTPEHRNEIISNHAAMQEMLRYGSWVQAVIFDDVEHTNREVIESSLISLSESEDYRKKFEEEIKKFIADTTGALIAIPEYDGTESTLPRFPHLIPLDVVTVFFTLLMQKIAR